MESTIKSLRVRWASKPYKTFSIGFFFVFGFAAYSQQSATHHSKTSSPSEPSPFVQAETLLSSGQFAQAKQETEAQLKLHPTSVEGYNLLGIICGNGKDAACALDSFQHALRLAPNSTKARNNLANLYVAEGKVDLAETEFKKVLSLAPTDRDANYN